MTRKMTFEQWWHGKTAGQQLALGKKFYEGAGGNDETLENFDGLVRDELVAEVTFKDATIQLVDKNGRAIPTKTVTGEIVSANRQFRLIQPDIDYGAVLARQKKFFAPEMQFCSAAEFETRAKALLVRLGDNKQMANLRKGVYLPLCLPKLTVADYGKTLEDIFLAAVERSYKAAFPDRTFMNYRKGELAGQVTVAEASRHQQIIDAMGKEPVVGIYFPTALQGFGIEADRQMIAAFPPGFALAGALDIATAIVAYTDTLARDYNVPTNDCAASCWLDHGCSLYFHADDDGLEFGRRYLGASGFCSGGVVLFG